MVDYENSILEIILFISLIAGKRGHTLDMAPGFALVKHDSNFFTDFKVSAKIIYILG